MEVPEYHEQEGPSFAIGNTTDAIVESQSTQLLDFVLGRPEPTHTGDSYDAQPHGSDTSSSVDRHSKESGDIPYHTSASGSPYHFHGLVNTQSPTQIIDSGGSQKENGPAQAQSLRSSPGQGTRDASKAPLTPRVLSAGPLLPRPALPPPPQPAKPVVTSTIQRGKGKEGDPTKEKTPGMRYRRRPSPVPSQDSFAGPTASQDPDLFIATSRQFVIPVDQLGQSHSQDTSPVESRAARSSLVSSEPAGPKPPMDEYSLSSGSSAGRILVAASQSSSRSQGSHGNSSYSISEVPTQIVGDVSDAGMSDHFNDIDEVDQVPDASTHVELSQGTTESIKTQEPTQIVEETRSIEIDRTSGVPGPSAVPERLSGLSLVPPERRPSYMLHSTEEGNAHSEPTPGPSTGGEFVESSAAVPSVTSGKRSLLDGLPPEKRARYMHHFQKNDAPSTISEASRLATLGTSLGIRSSEKRKSSAAPTIDEEIVQDSEQQIEMEISPVKRAISRDQEVIPASESDVGDNSREEEDDEVEAGLDGVEGSRRTSSLAKGKQKATLGGSPRKRASTKVLPGGPPSKSGAPAMPTAARPPPAQARPLCNSMASSRVEVAAMGPPPVPESRGRVRPSGATKAVPSGRDVKPSSLLASTSAAVTHRIQQSRPATPTLTVPESSQDSPEIPLARLVNRRDKEEGSEIEEEEVAPEEEVEDEKPQRRKAGGSAAQTRKRKRRNPALTTKKGGKGKATATRKRNTADRAASIAPPPSKKARTNIIKRFGTGIGTQVFALFKGDSSFYGAEVHSLSGSRAHVKFFDGLEDPSLGVAQMRRFELREGDFVIPGSKAYKARVTDDGAWATENVVHVEYTEGPEEGLEISVSADALRIPARSIQSQWKDRVMDVSEIVPAIPRKTLKDTPSPSKNFIVNVVSAKTVRNKVLSKYGIIITQGPGNQNWSREKEKYIGIVKENGGTVLSDWLDVFSFHGKHTYGNKRWTIQRSDVRYSPKDKHSFDRVFLVSDVHNQKPKYLLALALGIPCVSVEWLDILACGEEIPWSRFLLASGHSEPLGAPVSQLVDLDWGSSAEHMTEIMENQVPMKVLSGTSIMCLGSDLFPQPPKKFMTEADRTLEASRTVPRIILAMGAERVEAVTDTKHASEPLSRYDYIVVKEAIPHPLVSGATYVDVAWIKECLIASRLSPPTEWRD